MNNNAEVDVNVLVGIYNQKIAQLTNQNILLEAKLKSLEKDKEDLLNQLEEARKGAPKLVSNKTDKEQEFE